MKTLAAIAVLSLATLSAGQEVQYVDLVGVTPRLTLRTPDAPPAKCNEKGVCGVPGSSFGGIIGDGAPDSRDPRALRISITALDSVVYSNGDTLEVEFKVENAGTVPLELPVSPHVADLQPADEKQTFSYESLSLVLDHNFTDPITLYGNREHTGTLVTLKPGEWIRVRGVTRFNVSEAQWEEAAKSETRAVRGEFWLRHEKFIPQPGGALTQTGNTYPRQIPGEAMMIRLRPHTSGGVH
jgi:hypothetical protein